MPPATAPIPTLTDGTVTLRGPRPDDAQGAWEQARDPASQRWTTVPVPSTRRDAEEFVGEILPGEWADGSGWGFVVEVAGRFAGSVALRDQGHGRAEVGYGAHPWVRGSGHVERALRLLLEWGFAEKRLRTVIWYAHVGNWPSRRLAWRVGFSFDGTVRRWQPHRGELVTSWVGTLLHDEPREPRTVWLDHPVLEGDGVRIRPPTTGDVPRIVEAAGDPVTQHWLAFLPREYDDAHALAYLEQIWENRARAAGLRWALTEPGDDRFLGNIGLFDLHPQRECEVGYWLHPDARGRGLARRGAALALRHAFEGLGVQRVQAFASASNVASLRVLEALGMTRTGVQRAAARTGAGGVEDLVGYDLLATEYASRRR